MAIKVTFGDNISVLDSGAVIQFNQEPFKFQLTGENAQQTQLFIEVRFLTDIENTETLISFGNGGPNNLIINLINFDNKINHGNVDPMKIGSLDNRELFFSFRITSAHENFSRTLEYTFYLGRNIQDA